MGPHGLGKAPDLNALHRFTQTTRLMCLTQNLFTDQTWSLLRGGYARNLVPQRDRRVQREGTCSTRAAVTGTSGLAASWEEVARNASVTPSRSSDESLYRPHMQCV